jgi:hypothetical protein
MFDSRGKAIQDRAVRQFGTNQKESAPMKSLFVVAGIFIAILLSDRLPAQTGTGFPPLPPVPQTPQLKDQPNATHFWFIVAGDNRPRKASLPQPQTPSQIFNDAQRFKPAFFLWSGDTIYGHKVDRKTLQRQYQEFFKIAHLATVPVFNCPGNHEMDTSNETVNGWAETPDPRLESIYLEMMQFPKNAPPYGAFNYGNSRFIAVDTEEVTRPNPTASPSPTPAGGMSLDPGYVSQVQFDLLKQDLDANQTKAHIFVFMHHPIMPANSSSGLNGADAGALQALFQKYPNVSYVIAAHEHLFYNATGTTLAPDDRQDPSPLGPSYLVSGGAGAPLGYCPGSAGSRCRAFNHYLAFEVDQSTVKVQVVEVSSETGKKAQRK